MVLMPPPSVLATGCVQTSSRFATAGRGNTDRSSPGIPPGWELTYHVNLPLVQIRLSRPVMVCEPESGACPNHAPDGVPIPGLIQGSPRLIALFTAWSGSPDGQVDV